LASRQNRLPVIIIASVLCVLSIAVLPSCASQPEMEDGFRYKAAIIDQLHDIQPNPPLINGCKETLEANGYSVDVWQGKEITVDFYEDLPEYAYNLIIFRAHLGILCMVNDSEVLPVETTCLFTDESYSTARHVPEQMLDRVYEGVMLENYPSVFTIGPRFVKENMNGSFKDTAILMMGCSSLYSDDLAESFIKKGASLYMGWSATVTLDYVDTVISHIVAALCDEKLPLNRATSLIMRSSGPDPYYNARLKYFPLKSGGHTLPDLIN